MIGARRKGMPTIWRLGDAAPQGPHLALVPGVLAPLLPLDLPQKLRGLARQRVAERQLVEHLSKPSDAFEILPLVAKRTGQWSRVLVADAEQASAWRKALRPGCIALLPDYLALPAAPELWVLDVTAGVVSVRIGTDDGFAAEPQLALAQLERLDAPRAVLRLGDVDPEIDEFLAGLDMPILRDLVALNDSGIKLLRWSDAAGGIDLKNPPSATIDRLRKRIRRWRVPAVFGALAVAVWLGAVYLETQRFQSDAELAGERTQALVREYFVPSGPILDLRAQVSAVVAEAAIPAESPVASQSALTQFQIAAPVLSGGDVGLVTASYRDDTGLVVAVEAANFAALDQLIADLQSAEFVVEQLDSRAQQSGGVLARLRLELLS